MIVDSHCRSGMAVDVAGQAGAKAADAQQHRERYSPSEDRPHKRSRSDAPASEPCDAHHAERSSLPVRPQQEQEEPPAAAAATRADEEDKDAAEAKLHRSVN